MATKKMAILTLTPEVFRALLQLPPEVEVVRVELAPNQRGTLHVMIEGAGWTTVEGAHVMAANTAIVTTTRHVTAEGYVDTEVIDWRLPKPCEHQNEFADAARVESIVFPDDPTWAIDVHCGQQTEFGKAVYATLDGR